MDNYSTIEGMIRQSTSNPIKRADCNIKFKATHDDAVLPQANNSDPGTGDTGYDLVAVEDVLIPHCESGIVPVGLTLADITPGYWLKIEPRSGLGFKHSIQPHLGVIDNGYRGDLGVKLYNFDKKYDYQVQKGDKIAQLVVYKLIQPHCQWALEVTDSKRGSKGFGSSDKTSKTEWLHKNTYQMDEGSLEHARFKTVEEFVQYAKDTDMPDDIFSDWLAAGVWKSR